MPTVKKKHTVVFVGCGSSDRERIRRAFVSRRPDLRLEFAPFAEAGLAASRKEAVEAVFIDHRAGDHDGFAFLKELRAAAIQAPTVLMAAPGDEASALKAFEEGVSECVVKDGGYADSLPAVLSRARARHEYRKTAADGDQAIIQSQKQWMTIFDAITDFIFITDDKFRLVKMNRAFASVFGAHPRELIGSACYELFGSDASCADCAKEKVLRAGEPCTTERTVRGDLYQVSVFPLHADGRPLSIHVMKNITEMKKLKDQLHYSDKLASLGLLVSGVAHEINNPLTGIIAYTELLRMKALDRGIDAELEKILNSAERCKRIVENLLTFSRQKVPTRSLESINNIIDRTIDLRIYWLRTSNIEIVREYGEVPAVFVDSQQIQQVFLNVLLNAEQAINDTGRGNGRVVFRTAYDRGARKVMIAVSDNGTGISGAVITRVFDPFFTTKPVGVGTGLGLSISHGIITEHGGRIRVESAEGEGTTLAIELPTGADAAQASARTKADDLLES